MPNLGFMVLFVCVAVLFFTARQVHSARDQHGVGFNGQAGVNEEPLILEVATFNVQTGKSEQGHRDISRAASVLADVHLAGVQEVYARGWVNKLGLGRSQTEELAAKGKFAHLFAATRYRWFREQRGNANLTKLPILNWRVEMLPDQSRKSPRNMSVVEFEWLGKKVVFINTHLHTGRGRTQQLKKVLKEFSRHPRVILVGDFNTNQSDPQLAEFLSENPNSDAIRLARLSVGDTQRIDWILVRGFEVIEGRELARGVSDHPFYAVSLKLVP